MKTSYQQGKGGKFARAGRSNTEEELGNKTSEKRSSGKKCVKMKRCL